MMEKFELIKNPTRDEFGYPIEKIAQYSLPSLEKITLKINEIIDYLNKNENK